jgi:hypothetical protein
MTRYLFVVVFSLFLISNIHASSEVNTMDFKRLLYTAILLPEAPQEMVINADGAVTYSSHTNMDAMAVPEIGSYKTVLDASKMAVLRSVLKKGPVSDLPDHSRLVIPSGIETQILEIMTSAQTIKKIISRADPVDPGLKNVFDYLETIVNFVKQSPIKTIRLETLQIQCSSENSLEAIVQFTNSGTDSVCFRSPKDIIKNGNGQIYIETWPKTALPGSMWSEQKIIVDSLTAELLDTDPSMGYTSITAAGYYMLNPDQSLRFRLNGRFQGQTKEYIGRIFFNNAIKNIGNQEVIIGEIYGPQAGFMYPLVTE